MADWNTQAKTSNFDVNAPIDKTINDRSAQRSSTSNMTSLFASTSVVGINGNQIQAMLDALDSYCNGIEVYLSDINPETTATNAFKSEEVNAALKNYLDSVRTYCLNLVSQLRAFKDKLVDVKEQWEAAAQSMSETIGSTSGSNFAQGTKYTETKQQ